MNTATLLERIQPQMDSVDLDKLPARLINDITRISEITGVNTPEYAKRLLVLSENNVITNDEYVGLVMHLSQRG